MGHAPHRFHAGHADTASPTQVPKIEKEPARPCAGPVRVAAKISGAAWRPVLISVQARAEHALKPGARNRELPSCIRPSVGQPGRHPSSPIVEAAFTHLQSESPRSLLFAMRSRVAAAGGTKRGIACTQPRHAAPPSIRCGTASQHAGGHGSARRRASRECWINTGPHRRPAPRFFLVGDVALDPPSPANGAFLPVPASLSRLGSPQRASPRPRARARPARPAPREAWQRTHAWPDTSRPAHMRVG
jgi:hypothetical protein